MCLFKKFFLRFLKKHCLLLNKMIDDDFPPISESQSETNGLNDDDTPSLPDDTEDKKDKKSPSKLQPSKSQSEKSQEKRKREKKSSVHLWRERFFKKRKNYEEFNEYLRKQNEKKEQIPSLM
jgi:hypothetical protein